jgi:hypothetical protein
MVFASPTMKGEQPYWPDNLIKRYIKPVARANGFYKSIGWHTFRHTAKGERGRCEDGTGTFTARQQGCKDDDFRHGSKRG